MTQKHNNCPIEECDEARTAEQAGMSESPSIKPQHQVRPEVLKIFHARWKHNESGCRLLSGR
jgi:hypothetical protein